tara:strand:- start:13245 stop:13562 length:318 start_codon:yes stop_codon:yes gene_type:complete
MDIKKELNARLDLGLTRYGHGVRVDDDTTTWGTPKNSWMEMAKEELLDAIIYVVADYIRTCGDRGENDDNELIMKYAIDLKLIKSEKHRLILWNLKYLLAGDLLG